jgi:hypothetical protein
MYDADSDVASRVAVSDRQIENANERQKMDQKIAIVTTLKGGRDVLDSFLTYHLALGFTHIFLFFDDPEDPTIRLALKYRDVTIMRRNERLRQMWQTTRVLQLRRGYEQFIGTEVMARQMLNTEVSIKLALEKKIDWLLHIDIDELFYLQRGTLPEHFQSLTQQNIEHVTYHNYEAIPETLHIKDYFKETTLFKINPATSALANTEEKWRPIIKLIPQLPERFFLYYKIGKSAVRLNEQVIPESVHSFEFLEQPRLTPPPVETADAQPPKFITSEEAVILHYPCCGFEHFWSKYVILGPFSDKWFGKIPIVTSLPIHLDSRDVVLRGDREAAIDFYRQYFMLGEMAVMLLANNGLVCRIDQPSMLLREKRNQAESGISL